MSNDKIYTVKQLGINREELEPFTVYLFLRHLDFGFDLSFGF